MKRLLLGIVIPMLLIALAQAQNIEYAGSALWTGINDVELVGNYAYCAFYSGLVVLDITNPVQPVYVGREWCPGQSAGIVISGNYAYMAGGQVDLTIVDIGDPENPNLLGNFDAPGTSRDCAVSGNYAYLANSQNGLYSVDVSNPLNPSLIGLYPGGCYAVEIRGDYVYLANDSFVVLNISNPAAPIPIGGLSRGAVGGFISGFDIQGEYLFAVNRNGFCIVDISIPASPLVTGYAIGTDFCDIKVSGNYAYVSSNLFRPLHQSLVVFNISDHAHIVRRGNLTEGGINHAQNLCLRDSLLYLTDDEAGLYVVSISDPDTPFVAGSYQRPDRVINIAVSGNIVCAAGDSFMTAVLDVDNPADPRVIGHFPSQIGAYNVAIQGQYAYTADVSFNIFGISDPVNPVAFGSLELNSETQDMQVAGRYAYVVASGLKVVDIADPSTPILAGSYYFPGWDSKVSISGSIVGIVSRAGIRGLMLIDVSNPTSPSLVCHYNPDTSYYTVYLNNGYAYLGGRDGLRVLDIVNPSNPIFISEIPGLNSWSITSMDNYLYATSSSGGFGNVQLVVSDISNQAAPRELFRYGNLIEAADIAVNESYIYIADHYSFIILRHDVTGIYKEDELPISFSNIQNYPNPFNARTVITYSLSNPGHVSLLIYNPLGQKVATLFDGVKPPGPHSMVWRAEDIPSGVYFARLESNDKARTIKMVVLK